MKRLRRQVNRFLREERGQVLPLVATCMVLIMGLTALSIDGGRAYAAWRALQAATDAEALAAAQAMQLANAPSDVYIAALKYSATTGKLNASGVLPNVTSPQPVLECLNTLVAQTSTASVPSPTTPSRSPRRRRFPCTLPASSAKPPCP